MKEQGENYLQAEKERNEKLLTQLIHEIEDHQKREHRGLPMSTCHDCLNYQQKLLNLEDLIRRYDAKLGEG